MNESHTRLQDEQTPVALGPVLSTTQEKEYSKNNGAKKVGWFRPLYYFAPPLVSLVVAAVFAYWWMFSANEASQWLFWTFALTASIQLFTAVREYRNWMFNFELMATYRNLASALESLAKDDLNDHQCG